MPSLIGFAALIRQYGKKVDGGYEVFIPRETFLSIPQTATLQEAETADGFVVRMYPNQTVEGGQVRYAAPKPAPQPLPNPSPNQPSGD